MFDDSVLALTLAGAAYLAYRFLQYPPWKPASEWRAQKQPRRSGARMTGAVPRDTWDSYNDYDEGGAYYESQRLQKLREASRSQTTPSEPQPTWGEIGRDAKELGGWIWEYVCSIVIPFFFSFAATVAATFTLADLFIRHANPRDGTLIAVWVIWIAVAFVIIPVAFLVLSNFDIGRFIIDGFALFVVGFTLAAVVYIGSGSSYSDVELFQARLVIGFGAIAVLLTRIALRIFYPVDADVGGRGGAVWIILISFVAVLLSIATFIEFEYYDLEKIIGIPAEAYDLEKIFGIAGGAWFFISVCLLIAAWTMGYDGYGFVVAAAAFAVIAALFTMYVYSVQGGYDYSRNMDKADAEAAAAVAMKLTLGIGFGTIAVIAISTVIWTLSRRVYRS